MPEQESVYDKVWFAQPAVVAGCLILNVIFFGALAFAVRSGVLFSCLAAESPWIKTLVYTFCFGGIGGTTYSIYGFYRHVAADDYKHSYVYWYLFRGFLGAVLGMVSFLLIESGMLALSDTSCVNIPSDIPYRTFRSKAMLFSAAFLAGYGTNQFTAKLQELSRSLLGVDSHKKGSNGK